MAEIRSYPFIRHLRSEASAHIARYRNGQVAKSGRGLAFWFSAVGTSIVEIPLDDRDMPFHFASRSKDFQEINVQGTITWRVADPNVLGERIDFSIDLAKGLHRAAPIDQIATLLTGLAQQQATQYLAEHDVRGLLDAGIQPLQQRIERGLTASDRLRSMGLEVITARLAELSPSAELERALQTPTFERLQQAADQATFERRTLAVEKERAIGENELQTKIELARRQKLLIEQEDENTRRRAQGSAEAMQIQSDAEAKRIRAVEQARTDMEKARVDIYRELEPGVLLGLAAREFAGKLSKIDHLNVTPDLLVNFLGEMMNKGGQAGDKRAGDKGR